MSDFTERIIRWLIASKILAVPKWIFINVVSHFIVNKNGVVFYDPERARVLKLIRQIKKETSLFLSDEEAYKIFMAIKKTEKINGDLAELGVYKGGSAKIICEAKGDRLLHLFDTFEGLPNLEKSDALFTSFRKGQCEASLEEVKNYLKKYPNVCFYKGLFPATSEPVKDRSFSFVHLDADLYKSTLNGLQFFYPRMNKGGIIIVHDYLSARSVRTAVDEFFKDKPEPVIELAGIQCLIVKL